MHVATLDARVPVRDTDYATRVAIRVLFSPSDPYVVKLHFVQNIPVTWDVSREVLTSVVNYPPGTECGLADVRMSRDPSLPEVVQVVFSSPQGSAVAHLLYDELLEALRAICRVSPPETAEEITNRSITAYLSKLGLSTDEIPHPRGW